MPGFLDDFTRADTSTPDSLANGWTYPLATLGSPGGWQIRTNRAAAIQDPAADGSHYQNMAVQDFGSANGEMIAQVRQVGANFAGVVARVTPDLANSNWQGYYLVTTPIGGDGWSYTMTLAKRKAPYTADVVIHTYTPTFPGELPYGPNNSWGLKVVDSGAGHATLIVLYDSAGDEGDIFVDTDPPPSSSLWGFWADLSNSGAAIDTWIDNANWIAQAPLTPPPTLTALSVTPLPDGRPLQLIGTALGAATAVDLVVGATTYPLAFELVAGSDTELVATGGWPSTDDGPITGDISVTTPDGTSNTLSLTINSPETQPSGGGGGGGAAGHGDPLLGTAFLFGPGPRGHRGPPPEVAATYGIRKAVFTRTAPAMVLAGLAVREPALAGVSVSSAELTAPAPAEGLRDAASVDLGATWRWLPRSSDYHDLGGGAMVWDPVSGTRRWAGVTGQLPYLDPAFPLPTAHGEITAGALVFSGGEWLQLPVAPQPQFTVAMVVRCLPSYSTSFYDLLASPSAATDRVRAVDLTLRYRGAATHLWNTGRHYLDDDLRMWSRGSAYGPTIKRRPVILIWSQTQYHLHYHRLDALGHRTVTRKLHGSPVGNYDLNLFLGRSGNAYDPDGGAHIQVFDLAIWRDDGLGTHRMAGVARKLNSIYGVHR